MRPPVPVPLLLLLLLLALVASGVVAQQEEEPVGQEALQAQAASCGLKLSMKPTSRASKSKLRMGALRLKYSIKNEKAEDVADAAFEVCKRRGKLPRQAGAVVLDCFGGGGGGNPSPPWPPV
jgi:hypothetical protein